MSYTTPYKIAMMGGGGVGKSAVTLRFIQNNFPLDYDPTIEDSYRKQIRVDEETVVLEVLDTAGQEEYSAMREQWIRYGEGFFLVYSILTRHSFEKEMSPLVKQLERVRESEIICIPTMLFANKSDMAQSRQVTYEEGKLMAEKLGSNFYEGSAKLNMNIEESFFDMVRAIRRKRLKLDEPSDDEEVGTPSQKGLNKSTKKKKAGCLLF